MPYFISDLSVTFLCSVLALYLYFSGSKTRIPKGLQFPPGPPRKFIIGNLTDLPSDDKPEYVTYVNLAKKYGDLVYLEVFGTSILLVNSHEMARELFEKRGAIYSDRMATTMLHDLTHVGHTALVAMQYSHRVTRVRHVIHQLISAKKIPQYWSMLEEAARMLLCNLHADPDHLQAHIRHALGATTMELLYGIKIRPSDDPFVELAEKTLKRLTEALAFGTYMVDLLPTLKYLPSWFPGLKFPAAAACLNTLYLGMMERPFATVEELSKTGRARPSFVTNYLERFQIDSSYAEERELVKQVATTIYIGGIDTTDVALQAFYLIMAIHPEVQKRAQEELDRVVGKDSVPSFRNQESLPYVNAICQEIQRWHSVTPVGVPHRLIQDDIVGEYFIPKGTVIIENTRFLLRSKSKYGPDADEFRPERFLDGQLGNPDAAFGYGRRVCPGRYFAEAGIFITVASTLHIFNISAYDEKEIREIFENDLFDKGVLSRPAVPYHCKLEIRPGLEKTMGQILSDR